MSSLITATNIAYAKPEKPVSPISPRLAGSPRRWSMPFFPMLLLGVALPLVKVFGLSGSAEVVVGIFRQLLLWLVAIVGLAVIYRYARVRRRPRWRWVTWEPVIASTP
jgi:uncharacterized BrkB/YihY/UPF0761 family membrane protein